MPLHEISSFERRRPKSRFEEFESAPPEMEEDPAEAMPAPADLASQGNLTDNAVGHLTEGEIVIPVEALKPELMAELQTAFQEAGLDLSSYIVGSGAEHMNDKTGMPEFAAQPGVGTGASNRSSKLARATSRTVDPSVFTQQRAQEEAAAAARGIPNMQSPSNVAQMPAAPVPAQYAQRPAFATAPQPSPQAPTAAATPAMPRPDPFQKLRALFASRPMAQRAPTVPYPVPQPGQAPVQALTPEENLRSMERDAARNPAAYQNNPNLMAQLQAARAAVGGGGASLVNDTRRHEVGAAVAPAAAPAPIATPAPVKPVTVMDSERWATGASPFNIDPAQAKPAPTPAPAAPAPALTGQEQMNADFAAKKKAAASRGLMSAIGVSGGAASSLSGVKSAESTPSTASSTPSTKASDTSDSSGLTADEYSKTNRLADVSST